MQEPSVGGGEPRPSDEEVSSLDARWLQRVAWANCVIVLALVALTLVFSALATAEGGSAGEFGSDAFLGPMVLLVSVLAARIVSHRPGNLLGPGLSAQSLLLIILGATGAYHRYSIEASSNGIPSATTAWLDSWVWVPAIMPLLTLLFLYCPDGVLPSRRWRPVAIAIAANLVLLTVCAAVRPGPLDSYPTIDNPYGVALFGSGIEMLGYVLIVLLVPSIGASTWAMVARFRRSRGVERQQLKWFAAAAVAAILSFVVSWVVSLPTEIRRGMGLQHHVRRGRGAFRHGGRRAALPAVRHRPHHQPHAHVRSAHRWAGGRIPRALSSVLRRCCVR